MTFNHENTSQYNKIESLNYHIFSMLTYLLVIMRKLLIMWYWVIIMSFLLNIDIFSQYYKKCSYCYETPNHNYEDFYCLQNHICTQKWALVQTQASNFRTFWLSIEINDVFDSNVLLYSIIYQTASVSQDHSGMCKVLSHCDVLIGGWPQPIQDCRALKQTQLTYTISYTLYNCLMWSNSQQKDERNV